MKRRLHVHAKHSGMGKGDGYLIVLALFFTVLFACARKIVSIENPNTGAPDTVQVRHIIHN